MASATATRETEVVKAAEDIVAQAAKQESKASVPAGTDWSAQSGEARAWDAKAQID